MARGAEGQTEAVCVHRAGRQPVPGHQDPHHLQGAPTARRGPRVRQRPLRPHAQANSQVPLHLCKWFPVSKKDNSWKILSPLLFLSPLSLTHIS